MNNNTTLNFENDLKRLEDRLDDLVVICDRLQIENKSLKEQQDSLSKERANLLQKNEQVRVRVEAMIVRLKSMEQGN
jgi:cell division protein ZapB|tara:strand:- start:981 stop:1211 length:231 start_codon:yes stop_codon:yes gene_type:complete